MSSKISKNILIVGGSGLVGRNCLQYFQEKADWQIVGTHLNFPTDYTVFLDPLNVEKTSCVYSKNWDVMIHTGALTHVDKCESEKELSYKLTVKSTEILTKIASEVDAKFIYISTDYVFDGENGPYKEEDRVNPLSVYGKHKLAAESIVQNMLQDYLILRVTNIYGEEERNKNFVARILDLLKEQDEIEITVPTDQFATPINARDIARAILQLIKTDKTGIYHLASTDYMSRAQVIDRIRIYFPNKIFKVNCKKTSEMNQPANRPLWGGLLAGKFLSEFPGFRFSNLDDFLRNKI